MTHPTAPKTRTPMPFSIVAAFYTALVGQCFQRTIQKYVAPRKNR